MPSTINRRQDLVANLAHDGLFPRLPVEIRFIIWNHLIFGIEENTPKSVISLLRCSRSLYLEGYHHLYYLISHNIVVEPTCIADWTVNISYCRLFGTWVFKGRKTLQKYLDALTYTQSFNQPPEIRIEIFPSNLDDCGRIVCLWKKVKELAALLRQFSRTHHVHLSLEVSLLGEWMEDDEPRRSVCQYDNPHNDDYGIVILPFTQFDTRLNLSTDLWQHLCEIRHVPELWRHSFIQNIKLCTQYVNLDKFEEDEFAENMIDFDLWMDGELARIPGRTGDLLRQKRIDQILNPFGKERISPECPSEFAQRQPAAYVLEFPLSGNSKLQYSTDLQSPTDHSTTRQQVVPS